jgi:hypothetical protein
MCVHRLGHFSPRPCSRVVLQVFPFFLFLFFIPILITPSSIFSYPYSHPLHSPSFCCTTIHCSPSQLLFLPLLIHSFPLHLPLPCSPNLLPHYPSLLHITTCCLVYCINCTQPQPPAIPDTNTLHYNNTNTPKHT